MLLIQLYVAVEHPFWSQLLQAQFVYCIRNIDVARRRGSREFFSLIIRLRLLRSPFVWTKSPSLNWLAASRNSGFSTATTKSDRRFRFSFLQREHLCIWILTKVQMKLPVEIVRGNIEVGRELPDIGLSDEFTEQKPLVDIDRFLHSNRNVNARRQ